MIVDGAFFQIMQGIFNEMVEGTLLFFEPVEIADDTLQCVAYRITFQALRIQWVSGP